jgi:hypothetical protein
VGSTIPNDYLSGKQPSPIRVGLQSGLVEVHARAWDRVEVIDERTLRVLFYGGPEACVGIDHVAVSYATERVTVTLFEGKEPGAEVCADIALSKEIQVDLDEPLAGRPILDGAA